MSAQYKLIFRNRNGDESIVGEYGQNKGKADSRLKSIAAAQKEIGAYHITPTHETFGVARALWRDGSYVEVWRIWE